MLAEAAEQQARFRAEAVKELKSLCAARIEVSSNELEGSTKPCSQFTERSAPECSCGCLEPTDDWRCQHLEASAVRATISSPDADTGCCCRCGAFEQDAKQSTERLAAADAGIAAIKANLQTMVHETKKRSDPILE